MRASSSLSFALTPRSAIFSKWWWITGLVWLTVNVGVWARPLTLAVADLPHAAPVLVAEAAGYFAEAGLQLRVLHFPNGKLCYDQLLNGQAQLATVADLPYAMNDAALSKAQIVSTISTSRNSHGIVVRRNAGLRSPADLKGRRVGVVKGTSAHFYANSLALFHGLAQNDVEWVDLNPSQPHQPLLDGQLDAAVLYEPWAELAMKGLGIAGEKLVTPLLYTMSFNLVSLSDKQAVSDAELHQFLSAVQRAVLWILKDPNAARATLGNSPAVKEWSLFDFELKLRQNLVITLEAQARWARREGFVSQSAPPTDFLTRLRVEPLRSLDPSAVRLAY